MTSAHVPRAPDRWPLKVKGLSQLQSTSEQMENCDGLQINCPAHYILIKPLLCHICPFHTVIPVNCRKITETTLPVNTKMLFTQAMTFSLFNGKAPFTHRFQITGIFCDSNQKWPLNGCVSWCCVCKHGGVNAISVFVDVLIFVSNVHIHAALLHPETSY